MKKLILLVFVFLIFRSESFSHSPELKEAIAVCLISGLQSDLINDKSNLTFSFDNNLTFYFINSGINYNFKTTTTLYAGIGIGSLIQIQYGKTLDIKENLIRVRLDWPLMLHYHKDENSILNYTNIGIYYINSDRNINFSENYGITISLNVNRAISKLKE